MSGRNPRGGRRRIGTGQNQTGREQSFGGSQENREYSTGYSQGTRSRPGYSEGRGRSSEGGRRVRGPPVQDFERRSTMATPVREDVRDSRRPGRGYSRDQDWRERRHTIATDSFSMGSLQSSLPRSGRGRGYDNRPRRSGYEGRDYRYSTSSSAMSELTTSDPKGFFANYYKVSFPENCTINMYAVDVNPPLDNAFALERRWHGELLEELREAEQHPHKNIIISDKSRIIYCTRLIDSLKSFSFSRTRGRGVDEKLHTFNVQFVKTLTLNDTRFNDEGKKELVQALETIFKFCAERYMEIRRCMFDVNQTVVPVEYFAICKGLKERVSMRDLRTIYINVDLTYAAIIPNSSLENVIKNINYRLDITKHINNINPADLDRASSTLKGVEVSCNHNSVRKRIIGFIDKSANTHEFTYQSNGCECKSNVTNYFKNKYKIALKFPNFPLIQLAPAKKEIFVPVELLAVKKWQPLSGNNPFVVKSMVAQATGGGATKRYHETNKLVSDKFSDINEVLKGFGITVDKGMAEIENSCLRGPAIHFHNKTVEAGNGQFNCYEHFYQPSKINHLNILNACFNPQSHANYHVKFESNIRKIAQSRGVEITKVTSYLISENLEYKNFMRLAEKVTTDCDFVVIIVPDGLTSQTYGLIKSHFDISKGIVSQVIKEHHFNDYFKTGEPKLDGVLKNVMLKINSKAGGLNFYAELGNTLTKYIKSDESTMVMGADVTHQMNTYNEPEAVSLASIVSSLDDKFCKYTNQVNVNQKGRDIIDNMEEITLTAIKRFYSTNKKYPKRIIMFRDGLSEGQHYHSRITEIDAMKKAFKKLDSSPLLTFICVQKRHNTRFYTIPCLQGRKFYDCKPGTLVKDPRICDETTYYLLSHQNIIGTAKSSQYKIIFDEMKFTINDLANFSFILCHNYARCLRSVSIPCPTYYAHLCAFRSNYHREELEKKETVQAAKSKIYQAASDSIKQAAINDYHTILKRTITPNSKLEKRMYFI